MVKKVMLPLLLSLVGFVSLRAQTVNGVIVDADTGEPLIGAYIQVVGGDQKAVSAVDGSFYLEKIFQKRVSLYVSYIGYADLQIDDVSVPQDALVVKMKVDEMLLSQAGITAEQVRNTEASLVRITRDSRIADVSQSNGFENDNWLEGWTEFNPESVEY